MGAGVGYADEISRALRVKFRGRNSCKEGRVVTPQNLNFFYLGLGRMLLCFNVLCIILTFDLCMVLIYYMLGCVLILP